eukprot:146117-Hanusia_phi.AAC.2
MLHRQALPCMDCIPRQISSCLRLKACIPRYLSSGAPDSYSLLDSSSPRLCTHLLRLLALALSPFLPETLCLPAFPSLETQSARMGARFIGGKGWGCTRATG